MSGRFTESTVEQAALAWLESPGWQIEHGPEIASNQPRPERSDYGQMVLAQGLRDTLLPRLISGELRVPDVEKILEEGGM